MTPARQAVWPLALAATTLLAGLGPLAAQEGPPPPMAERPISFPEFQDTTLANGLRLVVLPYGTQPVFSARLYVPGGSSHSPASQAGLASLTATVLTRGTSSLDAEEISAVIEGVGGSLSASAGQDFLTVSVSGLSEHLSPSLELLSDVVLNATFPEAEVELARRQALSSLQAAQGQPQNIASRHFARLVYGDHPYGTSATPSTVSALERDDLVAHRDQVLQPDGALLLVAGQVDPDVVLRQVEAQLGEWGAGSPQPVEFPEVVPPEETRVTLVHRPGSVQSVLLVGHGGLVPGHPDHHAVLVMNRVLGGGADARLFQILREERGWTYGAYSSVNRPADRGTFLAQAEVRTEVTDSATVELVRQIRRIRDERVPDEELEAARNFLAGSFPLRIETADQVAGRLAPSLLLGLPVEDVTDHPSRIRAVSAEDVQRVARDHLAPDRAVIVVVGDAGEVLESLEAHWPVDVVDLDGQPLDRAELLAEDLPLELDGTRLVPATWQYDLVVQDQVMGSADYRLRADGEDWVSTYRLRGATGEQEAELRFRRADLAPVSLRQDAGEGAMAIRARLEVDDGRLRGRVELPPQVGTSRDWDEPLEPGVLLPEMETYALAVSDLAEGTRIVLRQINLLSGETVRLEASVTGTDTLEVGGTSHETWVVEVMGGDTPVVLHLRRDAPHILVRQEFPGQPVRLDLTSWEADPADPVP